MVGRANGRATVCGWVRLGESCGVLGVGESRKTLGCLCWSRTGVASPDVRPLITPQGRVDVNQVRMGLKWARGSEKPFTWLVAGE